MEEIERYLSVVETEVYQHRENIEEIVQNLRNDLQTTVEKDIYKYFKIHDRHMALTIVKSILDAAVQGKTWLSFDYQYSNPRKELVRPGPPLNTLTERGLEWFRDNGFEANNREGCWGRSTSCDFGCSGDGICTVFISWNQEYETENFGYLCKSLSYYTKKYQEMFST